MDFAPLMGVYGIVCRHRDRPVLKQKIGGRQVTEKPFTSK